MTPGDRIREARELCEPKLPTKELDRLADVTDGHVWNLEKHGGERAEALTINKIAVVLGLSLDYVFRGEGEAPTAESVSTSVAAARAVAKPRAAS